MSAILLKPKYVLLDTSQYVSAFKYWRSGDPSGYNAFFEAISNFQIRPVFLTEHLVEFLAHENDDEIVDRVRFLQTLPKIATFKHRNSRTLGTVTDLWEAEIEHILRFGSAPPKGLFSTVIFESISFNEMFRDQTGLSNLIDEARNHTKQSRLDTSIVRMPPLIDESQTVYEFFSRARRNTSDRDQQIKKISAFAEVSALHLGDKRIRDPREVGLWLYRELNSMKAQIGETDIYEFALDYQGIPRQAINSKTTMREFSWLGTIGLLARVFSERIGIKQESIFWCLQEKQSRCIVINHEIESHRDRKQRSTGGAIWDRNFISCSPYVDVVYGDKNAMELVRRARRSEVFFEAIGTVRRAKGLQEVLSDLI